MILVNFALFLRHNPAAGILAHFAFSFVCLFVSICTIAKGLLENVGEDCSMQVVKGRGK